MTSKADLDSLTTAIKPHLEELVDIVHTLDTHGADTPILQAEAIDGIRDLIKALVDTPSWDTLFPDGETVRNMSGVYYRDMALGVSES